MPRTAVRDGFPADVYFCKAVPSGSPEYPDVTANTGVLANIATMWVPLPSVENVTPPGFTASGTDTTDNNSGARREQFVNLPENSAVSFGGNYGVDLDLLMRSVAGVMCWMAVVFEDGKAEIAYGFVSGYTPSGVSSSASPRKYSGSFTPSGESYSEVVFTVTP